MRQLIIAAALVAISISGASALTNCFLFICKPRHHINFHHHHRIHHKLPSRHIVIVKKVVVVKHINDGHKSPSLPPIEPLPTPK